ncbi:FGGY family carbohydrate kinase, partial [Sphingomonas bacterium]|uniref:FGGY family carbohydrate kinase n=1 Tax=Sphingomonas bacterium TaxID=1895847 RepID=UPI0020C6DDE7
MADHLLVIDEGTTSTRAMLFTADPGSGPGQVGRCVASAAAELTQHYPRPGWVEHDAAEIWRESARVAAAMVRHAG